MRIIIRRHDEKWEEIEDADYIGVDDLVEIETEVKYNETDDKEERLGIVIQPQRKEYIIRPESCNMAEIVIYDRKEEN